MNTEALKAKLQKLAKRDCWGDDTESGIDDYAGGNIDDAYAGGVDDGEAYLAREILQDLEGLE